MKAMEKLQVSCEMETLSEIDLSGLRASAIVHCSVASDIYR